MELPRIPARTIITRTRKPGEWFGIDYNMNLYRGCCHGCIYCDSRSSCYGIAHFDQVAVKDRALEIVRDELRRKTRTGVVGTGAMSDPYNPCEKEYQYTRHALELLSAFGFGAAIATKSALITRDLDVLKEIQQHSPVLCKITITTCQDDLSRKIEPHVNPSSSRFEALARLSEAGIFAGILMMPVLPFLEDSPENILGIVKGARESGAKFIYPALGMTLRENQRVWYYGKLQEIFPVRELVPLYQKQYGNSYECRVKNWKKLWTIFAQACEKERILYRMPDIIHSYQKDYTYTQLSLF